MNYNTTTPKLLGANFVFVFLASVISELMVAEAIGSGNITDKLINVSDNVNLLRIGILVGLFNCLAIALLGVLFYQTLHNDNKLLSLVALSWWLVEAATLAISKIAYFGMIGLSQEFEEAGRPDVSHYQTLGDLLLDTGTFCYEIHSLFFCMGGIIWYYLLYQSNYVPKIFSIWGLVGISLVFINVLWLLYDINVGNIWIILAPYIPFELVFGIWLAVNGFSKSSPVKEVIK